MRVPILRLLTLIALVTITSSLSAQPSRQWLVDTTTAALPYFGTSCLTQSGATIMSTTNTGYFSVLQRVEQDGSVTWRKGYSDSTSMGGLLDLASIGSGGLISLRLGPTSYSSAPLDPDTVRWVVQVAQLSDSGQPATVRSFTLTDTYEDNLESWNIHNGRIVPLADGGFGSLLVVNHFLSWHWVLCKFSSNLDLVWCKRVGKGTAPYPTVNQATLTPSLLDAGDGGMYIVSSNSLPGSNNSPIIYRLSDQGALQWARKVDYTNSANFVDCVAATTMSSGGVSVFGNIATVEAYGFVDRIGADGTLLQADLYSSPHPVTVSTMVERPNGDLLLLTPETSNSPMAMARMLVVNETGAVTGSKQRSTHTTGTVINEPRTRSASVNGDRLMMGGTYRSQDQVLGTITQHPLIECYDLSTPLDGCLWQDLAIEHYPVPAGIVQSNPITNAITIDLPVPPSMVDYEWVVSDLPPLATIDLCTSVVGILEHPGADASMLRSNIIDAGMPLEVHPPGIGVLRILDATGRTVLHPTATKSSGTVVFAMPSLMSGVHLLEWIAADGRDARIQRFIVL